MWFDLNLVHLRCRMPRVVTLSDWNSLNNRWISNNVFSICWLHLTVDVLPSKWYDKAKNFWNSCYCCNNPSSHRYCWNISSTRWGEILTTNWSAERNTTWYIIDHTTVLLIAGGLILAVSKLIEPRMGLNLFLVVALPYLYVSLIVVGFILTGLGLLRVVRRQWRYYNSVTSWFNNNPYLL
jgi:hypothetical protein